MSGMNWNRRHPGDYRPGFGLPGNRWENYDGEKLRRLIEAKYGSLEEYCDQTHLWLKFLTRLVESKGQPYIGPFLLRVCDDLEIELSDLTTKDTQ